MLFYLVSSSNVVLYKQSIQNVNLHANNITQIVFSWMGLITHGNEDVMWCIHSSMLDSNNNFTKFGVLISFNRLSLRSQVLKAILIHMSISATSLHSPLNWSQLTGFGINVCKEKQMVENWGCRFSCERCNETYRLGILVRNIESLLQMRHCS